uniref:Uncharacterized protein n=1 Tax=Phasianus colchicus TaxID=9054 RepID=A0A669PYW2_PHACC
MPQTFPHHHRGKCGAGCPLCHFNSFFGALPLLGICKAAFHPQVHKSRCHLPSSLRLLPAPPKQSPVAMVGNPCRRESRGCKPSRAKEGGRELSAEPWDVT